MWGEVADRLEQSLHNAILIRLDMTGQRSQVKRPWDADLRTASQAPKPIPPDTPIAEVFDRHDIGGKLLLLGNPGTGKTTTMLDLAATLIQRANADPEEPIPVMLNLSSWQNPQQSCTDWLLQELQSKYGVSPKLGQTWLTEKKLLPLLDGLDELPPARQEPVVQALNTWLKSEESVSQILVCSRLEEYEAYATKLSLNGAICLNPLPYEKVEGYLASLYMSSLWKILQQEEDLLELARIPLFLSIISIVGMEIDLEKWQSKASSRERIEYLIDSYIDRQINKDVDLAKQEGIRKPRFATRDTQKWLKKIAEWLSNNQQDELIIEDIQPYLTLSSTCLRQLYKLIFLIVLIIIITPFLILADSTKESPGSSPQDLYGLVLLEAFLIVPFFLFYDYFFKVCKISLVSVSEISKFSLKVFWDSIRKGVFTYASVMVILLPLISLSDNFLGWRQEFIQFLRVGVLIGLASGITGILESGITKCSSYPNQGFFEWPKKFSFVFLLTFTFLSVINFLEGDLFWRNLWTYTLNMLMISFFIARGLSFVKHVILRIILFCFRYSPWNYARFLNHCTERLLLQRVGGRYRFIHRLIQERFAALPLNE